MSFQEKKNGFRWFLSHQGIYDMIHNHYWLQKLLNLHHQSYVNISVPLMHLNEAKAGSQALFNKPEDETSPGCAIDVSYMRWQIQAIPCVPSVIISFSPGWVLSECPLTTSNVHCCRKRERNGGGASRADCSHG